MCTLHKTRIVKYTRIECSLAGAFMTYSRAKIIKALCLIVDLKDIKFTPVLTPIKLSHTRYNESILARLAREKWIKILDLD